VYDINATWDPVETPPGARPVTKYRLHWGRNGKPAGSIDVPASDPCESTWSAANPTLDLNSRDVASLMVVPMADNNPVGTPSMNACVIPAPDPIVPPTVDNLTLTPVGDAEPKA
jgi:hypothetical protein